MNDYFVTANKAKHFPLVLEACQCLGTVRNSFPHLNLLIVRLTPYDAETAGEMQVVGSIVQDPAFCPV